MFEYIYEWIQNLTFYLVIITAVMQIVPGNSYHKYIKFFSGLVMILLMLTPILKLTNMDTRFQDLYENKTYEQEKRAIEKQEEYLKDLNILDFLPEEYGQSTKQEDENIKVEGIQIGE